MKGTFQFPYKSQFSPMNGLAGVVKKNFPMSVNPRMGKFFFTTTAKAKNGEKL